MTSIAITVSPMGEAVRRRPAMYFGTTEGAGVEVMLWEVVSNAVDLHLGGRCGQVRVSLSDAGFAVEDDGPGFAREIAGHPLRDVLTSAHTTPTRDGHQPHVHFYARGCGLAAVNFGSARFAVGSRSAEASGLLEFAAGELVREEWGPPGSPPGVRVEVEPDATIFQWSWDVRCVRRRLWELAALAPGLSVTFVPQDGRPELLRPTLLDLLPPMSEFGSGHRSPTLEFEAAEGGITLQVAIRRVPEARSWVTSYLNLDQTPEGGTHAAGLRRGYREAMKGGDAYDKGLQAVIHVIHPDPTYAGPTRGRLDDPAVGDLVARVVRGAVARSDLRG